MRIIAINSDSPAVVDVFLKYLSSKAGTENKEIFRDQFFINYNVLCSEIIFSSHQDIKRRLRINNDTPAALHNCTGNIVSFDFFQFHFNHPFHVQFVE